MKFGDENVGNKETRIYTQTTRVVCGFKINLKH